MIAITLDIDWAPDFAIDAVADQLIENNVKATWFVTHSSAAIQRLQQRPDLFELGIHPNFLPGSTHGQTPEEVLRHCLKIVPEAECIRTHGLVQSTQLLSQVMRLTSIKSDVSLFLPYANNLQPVNYHWEGRTLRRIPYYWEDDFEIGQIDPCFHVRASLVNEAGLQIFNFHPIHIYINSCGAASYESIKRMHPYLQDTIKNEITSCVNHGEGVKDIFDEVVGYLANNMRSMCVRDMC